MGQVTYLLGAGASANAIPPVADISQNLSDLIKLLDNPANVHTPELNQSSLRNDLEPILHAIPPNIKLEFINRLNDLLYYIEYSPSIDTVARKLFITKQTTELKRYKALISLWLAIQQAIRFPDKRYELFLATIINSRKLIDERIKIVSWNYDYQIEAASKGFFSESQTLESAAADLYLTSQSAERKISNFDDRSDYSIAKLNGYCGLIRSKNQFHYLDGIEKGYRNKIDWEKILADFFEIYDGPVQPSITFAWEHLEENPITNLAANWLINSKAIVIIGYSFPTFNREVDKKLFAKLSTFANDYIEQYNIPKYQNPEFTKHKPKRPFTIYIQDRFPERVKKRLISNLTLPEEFIEVTDETTEFLIPPEL